MAAEGGEAPPEAHPPAPGEDEAAEGAEGFDDDADDTGKSTVRMAVSKRLSRKSVYRPAHSAYSQDRVVVDRTALEAILDVSSRLQDIQKKSKVSMSTLALGHESYKDKQVNKTVN